MTASIKWIKAVDEENSELSIVFIYSQTIKDTD